MTIVEMPTADSRQVRTGAISFRKKFAEQDELVNVKHSKETKKWLRENEPKRLAVINQKIKKFTAFPIKTLEETKTRKS